MEKIKKILAYIDPSILSYEEWLNIGMALKHEGLPFSAWDSWSQSDNRYVAGECESKWQSFKGSGAPVTGRTIYRVAADQGYNFTESEHRAYDWEDEIDDSDFEVVRHEWLEEQEILEPEEWDPSQQLIDYLKALFRDDEHVGIVNESWQREGKGKWLPNKGHFDRSRDILIEKLEKYRSHKDISYVIGDWNEEAGAWIRFNPLDGTGVADRNVIDFRYALMESDEISIEKQLAIYKELQLPVAALVHSAGKSLHAIVKIGAANKEQYQTRVDELYKICEKNGLKPDKQNRNASRLSRIPGVTRNGRKQFLVTTHTGLSCWEEWYEWIADQNDDFPEMEELDESWQNSPPLADTLIDGVLRRGHKLMLSGPSKAGKSFDLIQLTVAIAEGLKWHGWQCSKGRVLYVNLELDRASCIHRFKEVYKALGLPPENIRNITIWNLRGRSAPLDRLAPKLIRKAVKKNYIAVIIDPIYKVITGDENSAEQMSHFCNQFDHICHELQCATIFCHHHSKGSQGQKKAADRSSGSGVFARDPDALLDLIELEITDACREQIENREICHSIETFLDEKVEGWKDQVDQDTRLVHKDFMLAAQRLMGKPCPELSNEVYQARLRADAVSGWRIEGTLREFPGFRPRRCFFSYPIHKDDEDLLADAEAAGEQAPWMSKKKLSTEERKEKRIQARQEHRDQRNEDLTQAFEATYIKDNPSITELAEYLGLGRRQIERDLKSHPKFYVKNGLIFRRED